MPPSFPSLGFAWLLPGEEALAATNSGERSFLRPPRRPRVALGLEDVWSGDGDREGSGEGERDGEGDAFGDGEGRGDGVKSLVSLSALRLVDVALVALRDGDGEGEGVSLSLSSDAFFEAAFVFGGFGDGDGERVASLSSTVTFFEAALDVLGGGDGDGEAVASSSLTSFSRTGNFFDGGTADSSSEAEGVGVSESSLSLSCAPFPFTAEGFCVVAFAVSRRVDVRGRGLASGSLVSDAVLSLSNEVSRLFLREGAMTSSGPGAGYRVGRCDGSSSGKNCVGWWKCHVGLVFCDGLVRLASGRDCPTLGVGLPR